MTNQDTYRGHTVGSHSDDRGGDSDLPCYCDRHINQNTTSIDEQLDEIIKKCGGASTNQFWHDDTTEYYRNQIKTLLAQEVERFLVEPGEVIPYNNNTFADGFRYVVDKLQARLQELQKEIKT